MENVAEHEVRGESITVDNIGGEKIQSTHTEKLFEIQMNSYFDWSTHIDKISIELKKRTGILRRIKNRVPKNKVVMIAEAIFNSKIGYGVAVFLNPIYEEEDTQQYYCSSNFAEQHEKSNSWY